MDPRFSIIIPVYNGAKYIQRTLDSIFNQTFKDFELIVVDGASTDSTLEILQENKKKIRIIISEKDEGMYDALNKGFALAKGEYLCYINSDDRLLENALAKVNLKFQENKYDMVFGHVNYISETDETIYSLKAMNLPRVAVQYIRRLPFAQQSCFWSRKTYKKFGPFDKSLKYVADSKFFLSAYLDKNTKRGLIDSVLGEYRLHNDSFSVGSLEKMKKESNQMKDSILGLKSNTMAQIFFEFFTKITNVKGIIKKRSYSGPKF